MRFELPEDTQARLELSDIVLSLKREIARRKKCHADLEHLPGRLHKLERRLTFLKEQSWLNNMPICQ